MKYLIIVILVLPLSGCIYTDSALEYAGEGTQRVNAGYNAKAEMTKHITSYLERVNKDCGVRITIVDGSPVTTVKDCVRMSDAMVAVNKMPIIVPQQIDDIADGIGDMLIKATNLVVPVASLYYGFQTHEESMRTTRATTESNNLMIGGMVGAYTDNFDNTSVSETINVSTSSDVSNTDISNTDTSSTDTSSTDVSRTDTIVDSSNNTGATP